VSGEVGGVASRSEGIFVFFELCGKAPASLPHTCLPTIGHVNLYTPGRECMSDVCCWCINSFFVVLLVQNAIFMLVFLNRLVMKVVSLPL
jgi:hypothetical protein